MEGVGAPGTLEGGFAKASWSRKEFKRKKREFHNYILSP